MATHPPSTSLVLQVSCCVNGGSSDIFQPHNRCGVSRGEGKNFLRIEVSCGQVATTWHNKSPRCVVTSSTCWKLHRSRIFDLEMWWHCAQKKFFQHMVSLLASLRESHLKVSETRKKTIWGRYHNLDRKIFRQLCYEANDMRHVVYSVQSFKTPPPSNGWNNFKLKND